MKKIVTWIVIADGDQAKIFEHDGPGKGLKLLPELKFEQSRLRAGEIMADKPGRSFASAGRGRAAASNIRPTGGGARAQIRRAAGGGAGAAPRR